MGRFSAGPATSDSSFHPGEPCLLFCCPYLPFLICCINEKLKMAGATSWCQIGRPRPGKETLLVPGEAFTPSKSIGWVGEPVYNQPTYIIIPSNLGSLISISKKFLIIRKLTIYRLSIILLHHFF